MVKKYIVSLTEDEKSFLDGFTSKGSAAASKIKRAQVLQLTDKNRKDGAWKDEDVSQALNVSIATVERTRKCFVEDYNGPQKLDRELSSKLYPKYKEVMDE